MATTVSSRPPEVNAGTTTSWLPMSTAWLSIPGCESSLWKVIATILAGWDPGYGIYVQQGLSCQPPQVTSWWDAEHMHVDVRATQYSLGPVVCPEAYSTAKTSLNAGGSTFVGCCPSGYSFINFYGAGITGECISELSPGEVVEFATYASPLWTISTSTVQTESVAYGIQVNGWLFPSSTSTQSLSSTSSPTSPATETSSTGLSTGAKIGIGVSVPLAVVAIVSFALAFFFFRRSRSARASAMNPEGVKMMPHVAQPNFPEGLNVPFELHGVTTAQVHPAELPTTQVHPTELPTTQSQMRR